MLRFLAISTIGTSSSNKPSTCDMSIDIRGRPLLICMRLSPPRHYTKSIINYHITTIYNPDKVEKRETKRTSCLLLSEATPEQIFEVHLVLKLWEIVEKQ